MPTKNELIEKLKSLSGTLSDRARAVSFVVIAICWAFLIEGAGKGSKIDVDTRGIFAPMVLALFSVLADFIQYFSGYVYCKRSFDKLESEGIDSIKLDATDGLYTLRAVVFFGKLLLCFLAILSLICFIVFNLK